MRAQHRHGSRTLQCTMKWIPKLYFTFRIHIVLLMAISLLGAQFTGVEILTLARIGFRQRAIIRLIVNNWNQPAWRAREWYAKNCSQCARPVMMARDCDRCGADAFILVSRKTLDLRDSQINLKYYICKSSLVHYIGYLFHYDPLYSE